MASSQVLLIVLISWYRQVDGSQPWSAITVDNHGNTHSWGWGSTEFQFTPGGNCEAGQFSCGHQCIPQTYVQDGKWDCFNGADEDTSVPGIFTFLYIYGNCQAGQFSCGHQCIPQTYVQDGKWVCFNGADEHTSVPRPDWTHETKACIIGHNNLVLDGIFTLGNCKARCEDEPGFFCRSVEYHFNSNHCVLSEATSSSSSYKPRCPSSGWEFTEKLAQTELFCEKKTQKTKLNPGDVVTFYSSNYPEKYDKNSKCAWKIMGQTETTRISITCDAFTLQAKHKKGKCGDYLEINGNRYCGTKGPTYSSNTNIVKMKFKANKKKQYSGFKCTAVAADEEEPTKGNCTAGQFNCGYKCIPQSWVQDGEDDCNDGADEDKSFPRPGPLPCGEGILEGDTWEENGCRAECKNNFIDTSDKRCGPVIPAYCEEGFEWTEHTGTVTLNCKCKNGAKMCIKPRPTSCVDGEIWVDLGDCTTYCTDGQWDQHSRCELVHWSPTRLAPLIPPHLNYCKILRNGQIIFGEYNARCNTCENCEVPECDLACHRFNTRTCGCRRNPFCRNKCSDANNVAAHIIVINDV